MGKLEVNDRKSSDLVYAEVRDANLQRLREGGLGCERDDEFADGIRRVVADIEAVNNRYGVLLEGVIDRRRMFQRDRNRL